jgi:hypothetical protein
VICLKIKLGETQGDLTKSDLLVSVSNNYQSLIHNLPKHLNSPLGSPERISVNVNDRKMENIQVSCQGQVKVHDKGEDVVLCIVIILRRYVLCIDAGSLRALKYGRFVTGRPQETATGLPITTSDMCRPHARSTDCEL